jgi:hypothetical protein
LASPLFGELNTERLAAENLKCREIVREIVNFGVTERQLFVIIKLLAYELESVDAMRELVAHVDELCNEIGISSNSTSGEAR